jgi:hypothetical protein
MGMAGMKIRSSRGVEVTEAPTTSAMGGLQGFHDPLAKVAFATSMRGGSQNPRDPSLAPQPTRSLF